MIWLENPTSDDLTAVVEYLSSDEAARKYPESYKYFVSYYTGHGNIHTFYTENGSFSYESIGDIAHHLQNPKMVSKCTFELFVHFFDCCRVVSGDMGMYPDGKTAEPKPVHPETKMCRNAQFLYATSAGSWSFGEGGGMSKMAETVIDLVGTPISLHQLAMELRRRISDLTFPSHDTALYDVILCEKRNERSKFVLTAVLPLIKP